LKTPQIKSPVVFVNVEINNFESRQKNKFYKNFKYQGNIYCTVKTIQVDKISKQVQGCIGGERGQVLSQLCDQHDGVAREKRRNGFELLRIEPGDLEAALEGDRDVRYSAIHR